MTATLEFLRKIPKVMIHDHLDGGLRAETVLDLAKKHGYNKLPTEDPIKLKEFFESGAQRGDLPLYLEGFCHTVGVMQTEDALERVAYETLEDMMNDGVYYLETRFAPLIHMEKGLTPEAVVSAVLRGLEKGKQDFNVHYGLILAAMRHMQPADSLKVAELAVKFRSQGVVGFDFAGAEKGFPVIQHIEAFNYITKHHFNSTIHAGEAFGIESIRQAVNSGAHRIGHGTKLVEDMVLTEDGIVRTMGTLAQYVLDKRIPLEICLTSNLHTGAVNCLKNHPFKLLHQHDFRVTLNTDDRLMSGITLTDEYYTAHTLYELSIAELFQISVNSMKAAFQNLAYKKKFIKEVLVPKYKELLSSVPFLVSEQDDV